MRPDEPGLVSSGIAEGRMVIELLPSLGAPPGIRSEVLRGMGRDDLYLMIVAGLSDVVVRRDIRRSAVREAVAAVDWSPWVLRRTALRARLGRHVRRDRLTARGREAAETATSRLERLLSAAHHSAGS